MAGLLISFRQGEDKGFSFFFKKYYKALYYFACRYMSDSEAAEDIVSESFIQIWARRDIIESESHLRNWLYRAARHLCFDYLQRQKTKERHYKLLTNTIEWEESDYNNNIVRAETLRQMKQIIELLPGQCKLIFQKLYLEGKTVKEAASELELSISTINNQKARGISLLRAKLPPHYSVLLV